MSDDAFPNISDLSAPVGGANEITPTRLASVLNTIKDRFLVKDLTKITGK